MRLGTSAVYEMSNDTDEALRGGCPIPFFGEAKFPTIGGCLLISFLLVERMALIVL